jgi:hypothetical protein
MTVTDRDHDPEQGASRPTRRLVGATLTVLLAGAAVLWWIAGSNTTMARWISLGVIVLALVGWYYSRESEPDE